METRLLDGNKIAAEIRMELASEIEELKAEGLQPGLAAVLVGDDPASKIYVGSKTRTCAELGMHSETIPLPFATTTTQLLQAIGRLNDDDSIDGILVQLPLPDHIDKEKVLSAIHPAKDVDGFHPRNVGRAFLGQPALVPCTPQGIVDLLKREQVELKGAHAIIIGRSAIVGKPLAILLLEEHCTVTICHSRTRDLAGVCRNADILVAAVGQPALVTRDFLKKGVVIVDVGMNRLTSRETVIELFGEGSKKLDIFERRGSTLVGDVHPTDPIGTAAAVTPVPGGVGPLTIVHLMKNTVAACRRRRSRAPLIRKGVVNHVDRTVDTRSRTTPEPKP